MHAPFDTLIQNGTVLDGTGASPVSADIGIRDDRIVFVGRLVGPCTARRAVDATGFCVAPGFIDAHSHSDAFLLVEPDAPSKVSQGVTTEMVGQCGASAAPVFKTGRLPSDWAALTYPSLQHGSSRNAATGPTWSTVADYRKLFDQVQPAVNVVLLAGHNTLRGSVMGYAPRAATRDEVAAMQRHLEQALDEGCSGLSTGLIYQPGKYAQGDEVQALLQTVQAHKGFYATHMRSEGDHLLEAIDEVLALGRNTGIRIQISHLKTSGERNWHKLEEAIFRIKKARDEGVMVHADRYPYVAGATDLDIVLPEWAATGGRDAVLERLNDPSLAARMAAELDAGRSPEVWSGVMLGGTQHPDLQALRGRTITDVAQSCGMTPGEAIVWILRLDGLRTGGFFFGMSEANLRTIYRQPWVMVGSDASIRSPNGPLSMDHPHPRAYGTFPRFLRLTQDENLMPLSESIRRITSLPAGAFGLKGRGRIATDFYADLVLFDPSRIKDQATFANPHVFSTGILQVWVNGRCCYDHGRLTGERGGCVLKSTW